VGLLVVGITDDIDAEIWADMNRRIAGHGLAPRIRLLDDLDHDGFLTVLTRSALYLRTPTTDGVASSVLESLALGIPVVAAANGSRPPGVIEFEARNAADLSIKVRRTLEERAAIVASLPRPVIEDTLAQEVRVLSQQDGFRESSHS
jgi:glycosyltransferase involved in cell wall biosynthesis